jgi:hypothetical protein
MQMSKHQYPTLHQMAMDYLPIQASAVPCERAFSSGSETLTARRNRIEPSTMEALQMLKYALKSGGLRPNSLNFTDGWVTAEQFMDEVEEQDPLKEQLNGVGNALEAVAE